MSKITNEGLTRSGWHSMLYSCRPTHMATVGVKGLKRDTTLQYSKKTWPPAGVWSPTDASDNDADNDDNSGDDGVALWWQPWLSCVSCCTQRCLWGCRWCRALDACSHIDDARITGLEPRLVRPVSLTV